MSTYASPRTWGSPLLFDPTAGETVRDPLGSGPGWWVGAPSAVYDHDTGRIYLYFRYRKPRELGRGVECRIAESDDGVHFTDIWSASKDDLQTQSMEKAGLVKNGLRWSLYFSFVGQDGRWRIEGVEAEHPSHFSLSGRFPALAPDDCDAEGVKDPAIYRLGGLWHMLVSYAPCPNAALSAEAMHATGDVYNTGLLKSQTGLAISADGRRWTWQGEILTPPATGWDAYCTRLSSIVRNGPVWIGYYDGSVSVEENYEEKAGLCFSHDLRHWQRSTLDAPWVLSPHASGSVRYVEAVEVPGGVRFYYEFALPDGSHDLRTSFVAL